MHGMESAVRNDALQIIKRVLEILETKEEKDTMELKELSNNTIHNASIFQDECSISIAVLIYALSKIIERNPEFNYSRVFRLLKEARDKLENDREDEFHAAIKKLFSTNQILNQLTVVLKGKKIDLFTINKQALESGIEAINHSKTC